MPRGNKPNKVIWKRDTRKYSNGFLGLIGKWQCFSLFWDACQDQSGTHTLTCLLPGIKPNLGNFNEAEGKAKAEKVAAYWFSKTGEGE